jgi:hypothetical protein
MQAAGQNTNAPQNPKPQNKPAENFQKYIANVLKSPNIFGLVLLVVAVLTNAFTHNVASFFSPFLLFLIGLIKQITPFILFIPIFNGDKGGLNLMIVIWTLYITGSYIETLNQASNGLLNVAQLLGLESALAKAKLSPKFVAFVKGRKKEDGSFYNLTTFNMLKKISSSKVIVFKFLVQVALAYVLASTSGNDIHKYAPMGETQSAASNLIAELVKYGPTGGYCVFKDPRNQSSPTFCANEKNTNLVPFKDYSGPRYRTEPKIIMPFILLWFLYSSTFLEGELLNVETKFRVDKPQKVVSGNKWVKRFWACWPYIRSIIFGVFASINVTTSVDSMVTSKGDVGTSIFLSLAFLGAWFACSLMPHFIEVDILTAQETNRNLFIEKLQKQVENIAKSYDTKKYVHSGGVSFFDWCGRHIGLNAKVLVGAISEEQYKTEVLKYEKLEKMAEAGNKSGQFFNFTAAEIRRANSRFHQLAIESDTKTIAKEAALFEREAKEVLYNAQTAQAQTNANGNGGQNPNPTKSAAPPSPGGMGGGAQTSRPQ